MSNKAPNPVPEGMHTLTTQFWFSGDCQDALDFYEEAFGAELVAPAAMGPDGKGVMHAMLKIGDSNLMLSDAMEGTWESGPDESATAGLWVYVQDCDAFFERAVKNGCTVLQPLWDAFWGDRMGKVKDPFGHTWSIATRKIDLSPQEMAKGQEEWLESMKQPS
jgi:PhnB protein